jgi:hypothetical protein
MTIYTGNNYRKIYEKYYGPVPKDGEGRSYHIHHIDGNHFNNNPENLVAVSIQEHYDIHYSQGDYGACWFLARDMKLSAEERSTLATKNNMKKVNDGTHHLLNGEIQRKSVRERVSAGTHHLLKQADGTSLSSDRVKNRTHNLLRENDVRLANGTHHLLSGEIQKASTKRRIENGSHNFLGPENNRKRLENGTHPSQRQWKCEHCGKEGKGASNYTKNHGIKCPKRKI